MPSAAQELLLLGDDAVTWPQFVASLSPLAWYRMQQTSGTNEPNAGSGGSGLDLTITTTTLAQTGKLGANDAYLFDGANSRLQAASAAAIGALTKWEYVFLVNPASVGEGNNGSFFWWANSASFPRLQFAGAISSISLTQVNTTPTSFTAATTTGLSAGVWQLVFAAYDDGGDRKSHIYKGVSGAVNEFAYSAQPALTGTNATPSGAFNLFNRSLQDLTFDGLADEVLIFNGNLTPAQRTQLAVSAGV